MVSLRHLMFRRADAASGPGIHTDEASSAFDELSSLLSSGERHALEEAAPLSTTRSNPRGNHPVSVVPNRELFAMSRLVTGEWGAHLQRDAELAKLVELRRSARGNPVHTTVDFFDRMQACLIEVHRVSALALANYDRIKAPVDTRDWLMVFRKIRLALTYVLSQRTQKVPQLCNDAGVLGLPFGEGGWGPIAKGNNKLTFVAYSELPMATCPGAGACAVPFDKYERQAKTGKKIGGWCYSFKAFAYPQAFARMFLSTLAMYFDREIAIISSGGRAARSDAARLEAALRGHSFRQWPSIVAKLALLLTRKSRGVGGAPKTVFMRLFVDGDINTEDNILAWMDALREIGPKSSGLDGGGHIEVYGYTKSWQAFVNAHAISNGAWPENYVVNMSSGSAYGTGHASLRHAMESLPITRGYFEAVPLGDFVPKLRAQAKLLEADPHAKVPIPPLGTALWAFDAERVRAFLMLQNVETMADADRLMAGISWPVDRRGERRTLTPARVRRVAYTHYLDRLVSDPTFGALVRKELKRDTLKVEAAYLDRYEATQLAVLRKALTSKKPAKGEFKLKKLRDKALALVLHEATWSYGLGGSCPLICGSCSDHPTDPTLGVHRCASRGLFKGKTIHIGLH